MPLVLHDPIYVMGLLREYLGVSPFYLNLRYTSDEKSYLKWLRPEAPPLPLPYLFATLDTRTSGWQEMMRRMWSKTKTIHRRQHDAKRRRDNS